MFRLYYTANDSICQVEDKKMKKCAYCHTAIVAGNKFLKTGKEKYMHAGCFREMYKDFPVAEVIKLCKEAEKER